MLSGPAKEFARHLLAMPWEEARSTLQSAAKEPKSARLLIELLGHRRVWIREEALEALWKYGRLQDARRAARISIHSKNCSVRNTAAEMMGDVGTIADVPALIEVLESEWWVVARTSAAESLGEIRTSAGMKALMKAAYDDPTWLVRAYAVTALCLTGDARYRPFILKRLEEERDAAVRVHLYDAMFRMGEEAYVEKIIDMLYEQKHWYMVYLRVCVMLRGIFLAEGKPLPDRAIKGLRRVMKYDVAKAAKWAASGLLEEVGIRVRAPSVLKAGKLYGKPVPD